MIVSFEKKSLLVNQIDHLPTGKKNHRHLVTKGQLISETKLSSRNFSQKFWRDSFVSRSTDLYEL